MKSQAMWGFIKIDNCGSCSLTAEIWVTSMNSTYHSFNQPQCITCVLTDMSYMSNSIAYGEIQKDIEELWENNPRTREDIYGEREATCFGCCQAIAEGEATIMALDRHGVEYLTHDSPSCYRTCEGNCSTTFVRDSNRYRVTRRSLQFEWQPMHESLDNEHMCAQCLVDKYGVSNMYDLTACENCSQFGGEDDFLTWASCNYCNTCYDDNVYNCEECDDNYWGNDGHDCDNGVIHQFDYKPSPIFFGHSEAKYWLGFELEVENVSGDHGTEEIAQHAQDSLGEHIYLKHDGSLSDGFEIVSHPHTLESHQKDIKWSVLDELRSNGFRSWNTDSCGIHVHVSRTAFGNGDYTSRRRRTLTAQAHELRFMKLVYDNQRQAERLAGRASGRWASFADKGQLVGKVKHGYQSNDRYSAINTENSETLEVRIFKGSLKKERVLSALEFVTACVEYTRDLKVTSTNKALSWAKFVGYVAENQNTYPHLFDKINESFINDFVSN